MKKQLTVFFFFTLIFSGNIAKAQLSDAFQDRLSYVMDSVCTKFRIKGVSAAVLVPDAGTWKGVYGKSNANQAITTDMMFGIGSNTKTYISTLMLKFQEEGSVDIDDTIGNWIKNYPNISGKITIRQLLNHTSGIYSYTENPAWDDSIFANFQRIWKPEEMLKLVSAPKFQAGKSWDYSNTNYLLAGLIIEKITQKPLNIALRDKILAPNGLNNTFLFPVETFSAPMPDAWTYVFNWKESMKDLSEIQGYSHNSFFSAAWAAGGLMTTAEDNVIFWQKLLSGEIINANSLNELKKSIALTTTISYGLGIFRYKNFNRSTIYSHGGTGMGFINENLTDSATGITISVLTNQDSVDNDIILNGLVRALHKVTQQTKLTSINYPKQTDINISIYPNPNNGNFTINYQPEINKINSVRIIDLLGKEVFYSDKIMLETNLYNVRLHGLKPGIYIVSIMSDNEVYNQKIKIIAE